MSTSEETLEIAPGVRIPIAEIAVRATRAGGPGGQNVNKVSSRIEIRFDVLHSPSLTPDIRGRLLVVLAHRIDRRGVLRIVASTSRSQWANRREALRRLAELLADALHVERPRHVTSPTFTSKIRRRESKERRSRVKQDRRPPRSSTE